MQPNVIADNTEQALKMVGDFYKSRFIGVEDLKENKFTEHAPMTVVIETFTLEMLESCRVGKKKIEGAGKGIIGLKHSPGKKFEIILNKTSLRNLKAAWELDEKKWIGGKIRVYRGKVNGNDAVICEPVSPGGGGDAANPEAPPGACPSCGVPDGAQHKMGCEDMSFPESEVPDDEN